MRIDAKLTCEVNGVPFKVTSGDHCLIVQVADVQSALVLVQQLNDVIDSRKIIRALKMCFDKHNLHCELRTDSQRLLLIGSGVGNHFWRILRLPPMKLSFTFIFAALSRRLKRMFKRPTGSSR